MMVYIRAKEKGEVIDFRESAPKRAHPNLFKGDPDKGIRGENNTMKFYVFAIVRNQFVV